MSSRSVKRDLLDITWEGEVVGQIQDLAIDNFHIYGKWIPSPLLKVAEMEARLKEEEHVVFVEIGHGTPRWIAAVEVIAGGEIELLWQPGREID
jgi:hypothetical protein